MSTSEQTYKIKKIYINNQGEIYRFKNHLTELGMKYNTSKQFYTNEYELSEKVIEEIIWLCDKNDYKYKITEETYADTDKRVKSIYKLVSSDENNFYITNRKNGNRGVIISIYSTIEKDIINITDCKNGKYFNLTTKFPDYISSKILEVYNMLVLKENELDIDFDLNNLIYILSILLEEYDKDKSKKAKLIKFKNAIISEIEKNSKNGFLCNCVRGFFPETEFYIKNRRIISSHTQNALSYQQEMKVWRFLSYPEHKKYIGVKRVPTLYEQFYGSKILATVDSFETKVNISKVKQEGNLLSVQVFNGKDYAWINKRFTKDELFQLVKSAR